MSNKQTLPEITGPGFLTLDQNGRIIFMAGGFPGSSIAISEGKILPIEPQKE